MSHTENVGLNNQFQRQDIKIAIGLWNHALKKTEKHHFESIWRQVAGIYYGILDPETSFRN